MFKRCRHKYVGRSAFWEAAAPGQPLECRFCDKVFVSDSARILRLPMGSKLNICQDCLSKMACSKCGKKLSAHFFTAECLSCGVIDLFCPDCAEKALFINLDKQERPEVIAGKIFSLVQELMNTNNKSQGPLGRFLNMFRKKRPKNPVELFPLIMNINMFFSDPYDVDEFMDGDAGNEDWWMN